MGLWFVRGGGAWVMFRQSSPPLPFPKSTPTHLLELGRHGPHLVLELLAPAAQVQFLLLQGDLADPRNVRLLLQAFEGGEQLDVGKWMG